MNKTNFSIRLIKETDNKYLYSLIRECLKEAKLDIPGTAYFDESIKYMSDFYKDNSKRKYFVLVDENDNPLGGGGFAEYNRSLETAELQKLYLDKAIRNQGWSYKLISLIEEESKKAGYKNLYLETHHNLDLAIKVYKKLNYTMLEKPLPGSEHGTMDYFFFKKLD
jgi:putative acetyltransferase